MQSFVTRYIRDHKLPLASVNVAAGPLLCSAQDVNQLHFGAFRDFEERAEAMRGAAMRVTPQSLQTMPLAEAIETWWEQIKRPTVRKPRTEEAYGLYKKHLKDGLGQLPLAHIHIGHLLEYQRKRHKQEGASASYVNHETNMLSQLLNYADLWDLIGKHFKPLPPPDWTPPKVLEPEEEELFFRVAAGHPQWQIAYWSTSITNNTSAYGTELRNLQLKHVFLQHDPPKFHVPDGKAKNEYRARVIPLNDIALKQMKRVIARAEELARKQGFPHLYPEHYIFPRGVTRNRFDVTRPASRWWIRNTFTQMRQATGLTWLNPRNFRNQIITKLFENGESDETITSIAGHTSIKMSRYYSRIRLGAKKDALSALLTKAVKNAG